MENKENNKKEDAKENLTGAIKSMCRLKGIIAAFILKEIAGRLINSRPPGLLVGGRS